MRVAQKANHAYDRIPLKVTILDSWPAGSKCRAIRVTELSQKTGHDMISLFFENHRMSGGGTFDELLHDPGSGTAVITFDDPKSESV